MVCPAHKWISLSVLLFSAMVHLSPFLLQTVGESMPGNYEKTLHTRAKTLQVKPCFHFSSLQYPAKTPHLGLRDHSFLLR